MNSYTWISRGPRHTERLGMLLAGGLQGGDILALAGDLGAGKTVLVRGIAQGLGIDERKVKSPTFVLVHIYAAPVPLVHMDAYRLAGTPEAAALDEDELFSSDRITCVEWAQRCPELFSGEYLAIQMEYISALERKLTFIGHGERLAGLINRFEAWTQEVDAGCS